MEESYLRLKLYPIPITRRIRAFSSFEHNYIFAPHVQKTVLQHCCFCSVIPNSKYRIFFLFLMWIMVLFFLWFLIVAIPFLWSFCDSSSGEWSSNLNNFSLPYPVIDAFRVGHLSNISIPFSIHQGISHAVLRILISYFPVNVFLWMYLVLFLLP